MSTAEPSPPFDAVGFDTAGIDGRPARAATPLAQGRARAQSHPAHDASYPLFDWLRFALASIVVLGHSAIIPWENAPYLAVQVFFALSGWLIGGGLLRCTPADIPRFFFNRGTRIWIPYFLAVALLYSVSLLRDPVTGSWLHFLAYDLTFTHNLYALKPDAMAALPIMPLAGSGNHFWSIAVEEQFYLAAPLLILLVPGGRSPFLWGPIAIVAVASASWFGAISLGVLAATLQGRYGDWHRHPVVGTALLALAAILLAVLVMAAAPGTRQIAPILSIAVVLLLARSGPRGPVGEILGGLSFALYLNAWIVGFALHSALKAAGLEMTVPAALLAYAIAVGAAALHFLLLERPVLRARGRLYSVAAGHRFRAIAYGIFLVGIAIGVQAWGLPFWN